MKGRGNEYGGDMKKRLEEHGNEARRCQIVRRVGPTAGKTATDRLPP